MFAFHVIVAACIPAHFLGITHSFLSQSMTVPTGHSHPFITQMRGQTAGSVSLHARWQLGGEAHSLLICPLMGQATFKIQFM